MSVLNTTGGQPSWHTSPREPSVPLFLAQADGDAALLSAEKLAGFGFVISLIDTDAAIAVGDIAHVPCAVVQVSGESQASFDRFKALAASGTPMIAAAYDPSLKLVRELILAGAHDVLPLPIDKVELERSLNPIRDRISSKSVASPVTAGKIVAVLKSVGGVGATSLATQTAIAFSQLCVDQGCEVGFLDLDVQFGDAAFQLGLDPKLSIADLVGAGSRLDGALLQATATKHSSGLSLIAAPPQMMPLEALSSETVIDIVDIAAREFGYLFVDLPTNWTNWSLSVLARADIVLMITEMTVSCLHRARRQLELLSEQDLSTLDVRVVVNRVEKGMFKSVGLGDVEKTLMRPVAFTIANDHPLMRAAIDRGVPLATVKSKSSLGRDIRAMAQGLATMLKAGE